MQQVPEYFGYSNHNLSSFQITWAFNESKIVDVEWNKVSTTYFTTTSNTTTCRINLDVDHKKLEKYDFILSSDRFSLNSQVIGTSEAVDDNVNEVVI